MYALVRMQKQLNDLDEKITNLNARNKELVEKVKDLTYNIKLLREMLKRRK